MQNQSKTRNEETTVGYKGDKEKAKYTKVPSSEGTDQTTITLEVPTEGKEYQ